MSGGGQYRPDRRIEPLRPVRRVEVNDVTGNEEVQAEKSFEAAMKRASAQAAEEREREEKRKRPFPPVVEKNDDTK